MKMAMFLMRSSYIDRLKIQLQMFHELVRTKNPAIAVKKVTNLRTLCEVMSDVCSSKTRFVRFSTCYALP